MSVEMIRRIIAETLNQFGRSATYDDYQSVGQKLYPEEIRAMAQSFERQGFVKWIKDGMRHALNVHEEDPNAPQVQLDLLPGKAAPAYLNIGTQTEPALVSFADATEVDMRTAIATRVTATRRITARTKDLAAKLEWFLANRRGDETIGAVCRRLQQDSNAARRRPAGSSSHV